jgi:hypothetical protein
MRHLSEYQIKQVACPAWEPIYDQDKEAWPGFLEGLGYRRTSERAFGKNI